MPTDSRRVIRVDDGTRLQGRLTAPDDARAGVLVLHPHPFQGGTMGDHVVTALADACATRGLASLRFDFRHALSRARVEPEQLFADALADARAATANLRAALPEDAPVALAGYSFGGWIAIHAARDVDAGAVAVVGLPVKGQRASATRMDLPGPLLVLQGQYDEVGTPGAVKAFLSEGDVNADVRPVPDASHGYFGEAAFVARIAAGFLAKRLV